MSHLYERKFFGLEKFGLVHRQFIMQLGSYSKTGIRKIIRVGVRKVWSESPRIDYCISNHDDVYYAAACIRPTRLLMQAGWPAINFLARIETFSLSYFV